MRLSSLAFGSAAFVEVAESSAGYSTAASCLPISFQSVQYIESPALSSFQSGYVGIWLLHILRHFQANAHFLLQEGMLARLAAALQRGQFAGLAGIQPGPPGGGGGEGGGGGGQVNANEDCVVSRFLSLGIAISDRTGSGKRLFDVLFVTCSSHTG
jgi:hypothetical protein